MSDGRAEERKSRSMDARLSSGETSRQRQNCQISKSSSDRSFQNLNILLHFVSQIKEVEAQDVFKVGAETSALSSFVSFSKLVLRPTLRGIVILFHKTFTFSRFSSQTSRWITCSKLKLQACRNKRHHRLLPRTTRFIQYKTSWLTMFLFSGTKYDFWLYYSNSTISDWLTWTGKKNKKTEWSL